MNQDDEELPATLPAIEINPSAIRALILMLIRVAAIVASAFGTIVVLVKTRDLAGVIVWIKSDEFTQLLVALGLLSSLGASIWATLAKQWREVYLARRVPDRVAVVKEPKPAPAIDDLPLAP